MRRRRRSGDTIQDCILKQNKPFNNFIFPYRCDYK